MSQTSPTSGTAGECVASPTVQDIKQSLRFVTDRMAHYRVPGLSLAFIHNGTVGWTQAFGVARVGGEPVTPETLFQASSDSMPVTAVAGLRPVGLWKMKLRAACTARPPSLHIATHKLSTPRTREP